MAPQMASGSRALLRAAASASKRSPASARFYADRAYPFTKASDPAPQQTKSPADPKAKAAYPFTQPTSPAPVASPTRPVERPGPVSDDSRLVSREVQADVDYPTPDYDATADYRTSTYSPVPMRVMDGSEDTGFTPAAVVSGAPTELQARTVRIFKPTKPATQSGAWHTHHWQMDWDILPKGHRWENPLMGWQSSGDYMQGTKLNFKTKEDAIRFAQKQGYEFFVQEPNERRFKPKQYATQFLHSAGPIKQVRTK